MDKFHQGETVPCKIECYYKGTLTTPDTSVTLTIKDANNGAELTDQAMSPESTGVYRYDYDLGATATTGKWRRFYTITHGGDKFKAKDEFEVEQWV